MTVPFYLSQRFILKLFLMLKESVEAVLLHNDFWLVWEEDGVTIKRHSQLSVAQIAVLFWHKHGGCSNPFMEERNG